MTSQNIITVHLKPNAKINKVSSIDKNTMIVHTTAVPTNNQANNAMIKIISKFLKIPQSNIIIMLGRKNRIKTVAIKK
ncbi:DUF167 domain-containing protein [Candidatus Xenohaliotis californiensis]|uniref:DUF167 domain-containing protein n=1 Tax=Candidatus Xenohaliotis californiensis TaxID=84677 RepID=A0ABP0EWK0_9RICK|nr:DUF167 domain-containing protein [Candidatus Xenohaliotis californiensis]